MTHKKHQKGDLRREIFRCRKAAAAGLALVLSVMTPAAAQAAGPGEPGSGSPSPGGPGTVTVGGGSQTTNSSQNTGGSQNTGNTQNTTSSSSGTEWKYSGGAYRMPDGSAISGVIARGIDVSRWQGDINWTQVAADDVSFVMLGTRSRGAVDPYFHQNIQAAHAAGVKVGVYIYSLATTTDMAVQEADFVLDLIKDYPVSYPVAFDMEDDTQGSLSKDDLAAIANAFCKRISDAGYYPIIYANEYWLNNKLDMSKMDYPVWVARYSAKPTYQNPVMWQATSTGSVSGISGNVDIDFQFKDFSGVIPANTWRTIGGNTYYYKNYAMQKNAWIDDGQGWYYMGSDGLAETGWLTESGSLYFLDEKTGKMQYGWKDKDGSWYYLGSSGAADKGWVNDNNTWYFTDRSTGVMKTGWIEDNGSRYYLKADGRMATGWVSQEGKWYYLSGSGALSKGWIDDNGTWYYSDSQGVMQTGLVGVNGANYYLDPTDGHMYASTTVTVDGTAYNADASGVLSAAAAPEGQPADGQPANGQGAGGQATEGQGAGDQAAEGQPAGGQSGSGSEGNSSVTITTVDPDEIGPGA